MCFETPLMNGNFGIAMMTLIRNLQLAWPLMNRTNSSPESAEAIRPNNFGPCDGQFFNTVSRTESIQTSMDLCGRLNRSGFPCFVELLVEFVGV